MDQNKRRDLVRDSGVHIPNSDEGNAFEDTEENPVDPCLNNAALLPIPEDEADQGLQEDKEEADRDNNTNENPGQENMPPQVNTNPPKAVQPQQLTALMQFDGNMVEAFVNWLECLETAKETCNWAENSLVQVAKAKGGAAITEWDKGKRLQGITVN